MASKLNKYHGSGRLYTNKELSARANTKFAQYEVRGKWGDWRDLGTRHKPHDIGVNKAKRFSRMP